MGEVGMLLDRVEALGEELEAELGEHFTVRQNRSRDYLGVNVMCNDFKPIDGTKGGKGIRSEQVPHWSCGLQGRFLRLYIQCESKPLVEKLVKQRDRLIPSMTEALWEAHDLPGLRLRVQEKLHIVAGGKGKNSPVWSEFAAFPLELYRSKEALAPVVHQAFDAMAHLLNSEETKKKVEAAKKVHKDVKSVSGVLHIEYQWNWLELQKEGTEITDRVKKVARLLKPCYEVLLEAYKAKPTRRSKVGAGGS